MMGGALFVIALAIGEFATKPGSSAGKLSVIIFIGCTIIVIALFKRDLRWTIRSHEIQIDKTWIFDGPEVDFVRSGEITRIQIDRKSDDNGVHFHIRLCRASGQDIESPPLKNALQARELKAEITKRLRVPLEEDAPS